MNQSCPIFIFLSTLIKEPIGVNKPRRIVVGMFFDILQKSLLYIVYLFFGANYFFTCRKFDCIFTDRFLN